MDEEQALVREQFHKMLSGLVGSKLMMHHVHFTHTVTIMSLSCQQRPELILLV